MTDLQTIDHLEQRLEILQAELEKALEEKANVIIVCELLKIKEVFYKKECEKLQAENDNLKQTAAFLMDLR